MLNLSFIKYNEQLIRDNVAKRNMKIDLDRFFELFKERNNFIQNIDEIKAQRNSLSKKIPTLQGDDKEKVLKELNDIKDKLKDLEPQLDEIQAEFKTLWLEIP